MYCKHLSLVNFRNYARLDVELAPHLSVLTGDNGQGKSNLLEAIYLLATSRSYRTSAERELVNWHTTTSPAFARVAAEVVRHPAPTRVEVILAEPAAGTQLAAGWSERAAPTVPGTPPAESIRRRVRINGQPRPLLELLGHLNVVLFSPEDVALIAGPAEVRRRYLSITLCQVDHRYLRALRRYQRVLLQRNALLRELRDRAPRPEQFDYWDAQLIELGAQVTVAHLRAIALLNEQLSEAHPRLTSQAEALRAVYRSSAALDEDPTALGEAAANGHEASVETRVRECFTARLAALQPRERQQGVTLAGPHRDDVAFLLGEVDLRSYGSRGQQRTAALSLKLAEVALMQHYTGERPVLLLDDVMSELDPRRQRYLQGVLQEHEQVLLTATELSIFSPDFLNQASLYRVEAGAVSPVAVSTAA
jgi:DNA replication and repair protein RecF